MPYTEKMPAVLDHCHADGVSPNKRAVRDAICRGCNTSIGRIENSMRWNRGANKLQWLREAVRYLEDPRHGNPEY